MDDGENEAESMALEAFSSARAIAGVSWPAILLNAAPPITVALQTALLGRYASTSSLAAFATVGTCVGFVRSVFNFLVDGVSSKVGRCVGQSDWPQLATQVRLSIRWSLVLGAAAVPLLLAARAPLVAWLLAEEAQHAAAGYWLLRSLLVPAQLVAMAAAGVLQGFGRVRLNAALTSAAAVLEMAGSAAVLRRSGSQGGLLALGCVTCACQGLLTAAALAAIVALPPPEARGRVNPLRQVFGAQRWRRGSHSGRAGMPLLADSDVGPVAHPSAKPTVGAAAEDQQQAEQQPGASPPAEGAQAAGSRLLDAPTLEFLRDGRDMFIRSMVLQLTFLMAIAAASRLGTASLAAHSIIAQLWVVVSYAVDGFAAAGIVLGSRLFGFARHPERRAEAKQSMVRLTARVLAAGALCGTAAGICFQLASADIAAAFTSDPAVAAALTTGGAWAVLAAAQPLNGLLFVFDGLLLATQHFRFVRNYMAGGFALVFCPVLLLEMWRSPGLRGIWLAKAALNVWRLAGAAYLIYGRFLPRFGEEGPAGAQGTVTAQAAEGRQPAPEP